MVEQAVLHQGYRLVLKGSCHRFGNCLRGGPGVAIDDEEVWVMDVDDLMAGVILGRNGKCMGFIVRAHFETAVKSVTKPIPCDSEIPDPKFGVH